MCLGLRITHPGVLEILSRCGGPAGIRAAGKRTLAAITAKNAPRTAARLAADIFSALEAQTVVVPGLRPLISCWQHLLIH